MAPHRFRGEAEPVFLGEDLLAWLVLALGSAMAVGNGLALIRPPDNPRRDDALDKAPKARSAASIVVGVIAAIWGLATLVS